MNSFSFSPLEANLGMGKWILPINKSKGNLLYVGSEDSLPGRRGDLGCASKMRWGLGIWRWRRRGWKGGKSMCQGTGGRLATGIFVWQEFWVQMREAEVTWSPAQGRSSGRGWGVWILFQQKVAWPGTYNWLSVPVRNRDSSGEMQRHRAARGPQQSPGEKK